MRYFADRLRTAQVVPQTTEIGTIAFGHQVTFNRDDGRRQAFRIVGEDEADPRNGSISYVSPVAGALIGRVAGDVVLVGDHEIEILSIEWGGNARAQRCYQVDVTFSTCVKIVRAIVASRARAVCTKA